MAARPVIDPDLPRGDRELLLGAPHVLTPASAPAPRRPPGEVDLPLLRRLRHATVALFAASLVLLVFAPALARVIFALLPFALAGVAVATVASTRGEAESPARAAARRRHGRYIVCEYDLDAQARPVMARAQAAADAVNSAAVVAEGYVEAVDNAVVLPRQLWDIAQALHRQSQLRSRAERIEDRDADEQVRALLRERARALAASEEGLLRRVGALESYAARVDEAERRYRQLRTVRELLAEQDEYRDLLAATAADDHAVAHIDELTARARAVERSLAEAVAEAAASGRHLPPSPLPEG